MLRGVCNAGSRDNRDVRSYDQGVFDIVEASVRMPVSTAVPVGAETAAFDIDSRDSVAHFTLMPLIESKVGPEFDNHITFFNRTVEVRVANISMTRAAESKSSQGSLAR